MSSSVFRLPPSRPVVWRTPQDVQIGIDTPHTSVDSVPAEAAPILHALTEGLSEGGLGILQRQLKVSNEEVHNLMNQLQPAFVAQPVSDQPAIVLVGTSPAVSVMAGVFEAMGCRVRRVSGIGKLEANPADGVILVADYVLHPEWIAVLGSRDIPHTPVVFSDLTIRVGPRIDPGQSPCLSCVEQDQRRDSPHWLAINSQLWGSVSPLSTPHGGARAAALAALCHGVLGLDDAQHQKQVGVALDYRPHSNTLRKRLVPFDSQCTCRGLAQAVNSNRFPGDQEND